MSVRQFMWNLAGMESQLPEEELLDPDETMIQENPPAEAPKDDRPDTPMQEDSPGLLSGFGSFVGFGSSDPAPSSEPVPTRADQGTPRIDSPPLDDPTTPKQVEPSSPFSLVGSWFSSAPAEPEPPALELVIQPEVPKQINTTPGQTEPGPGEPVPTRGDQGTPRIDSPSLDDPTTPKQEEAPSSPFSFMGSWFSNAPAPASPEPPALEPVLQPEVPKPMETTPGQAEPGPESEGIGGFFSSLWGGGEAEEPKPEAPAEAPGPSFTANPPDKSAAAQFDNTDAEDTVKRIENGLDPTSKRLQRLLVANEAEAQLRMFETEAAMRKLRTIQSETNAIVHKSVGMNLDGVKSSKSDGKLPPAKPTMEQIAASKLSTDALKKAREVLRTAKRTTGTINALTTKESREHWRASHSFEPIGAPSSRLLGFPRSELAAHPARPIPVAVPVQATRGSIVVASVESRPHSQFS